MKSDLKEYIRSVQDFPKQGIVFRDLTTLLKNSVALKEAINQLYDSTEGLKIDKVVGIESRGFIFGAILAERLNVGFIPVRKPGKLPAETEKEFYDLEYGKDSIEIHKDAISPGDKVLIHDDLLATGGTAKAAINLVEKLGGEVVQILFLIELSFLNGREKLKGYNVKALVDYTSE
ncbi:MAG: adenine phosphoribosyltransferase [Ignavibacteria bacterium RIFOXYB2_FULL_35_12]|nr:MAG: adenine phosphoribosyltransferase [Ignavibacteria bacterium GWA2_36_19]OGU53888.1 MAG: adenine phosphoribosyltransferase [Ignavibacteria bacterium GWC2_35_8]OGU57117.1 MAG: adenine phosphoribosyltransferase [Ignavibacteria bacterium GWF2_35_20]OGU83431.1 MAG: adenine phosphoribosyltransferase [Ignavibacteria bacterium RIFOXYA2_FULL_35_9]OGU88877.1 MAG: adenine phosphoribosyltransferase [Ignavibacteria bacterium RIFOXYA12_FULL_35_25]OGU90625.1 MAG: adenine phosphoribosyltransferase [Ign